MPIDRGTPATPRPASAGQVPLASGIEAVRRSENGLNNKEANDHEGGTSQQKALGIANSRPQSEGCCRKEEGKCRQQDDGQRWRRIQDPVGENAPGLFKIDAHDLGGLACDLAEIQLPHDPEVFPGAIDDLRIDPLGSFFCDIVGVRNAQRVGNRAQAHIENIRETVPAHASRWLNESPAIPRATYAMPSFRDNKRCSAPTIAIGSTAAMLVMPMKLQCGETPFHPK
jgi:hypothetical protein